MYKICTLADTNCNTYQYGRDTKKEASCVLKKRYPSIRYIEESDSFLYRGIEFDYFRSCYSKDPNTPNGYLLMDKNNYQLWLFTYGDSEDRWKDYLESRKRFLPIEPQKNKEHVGFFNRALRFLKRGYWSILVLVKTMKSLIAVIGIFFFSCCGQQEKKESPNHAFFQGRHELQQMSIGGKSSGEINGELFLLIGKLRGEFKTESIVKFAWKNNRNEFMLTVLPYNKVRIVIRDEIEKPYCKFRWRPSTVSLWNWEINWQDYIVYAVIYLKENQFKYEIDLKI